MLKLAGQFLNIAKPRKPRSPYTCWSMEKMPEIKRQNPNVTNSQRLHQILGMLWKEEDALVKKKYQKVYEQRMKIYERALDKYENVEPEKPKKKRGRPPKNTVKPNIPEKQQARNFLVSRNWKMKLD